MANLNPSPATRWQPGQSGNPGGRPAGESFASILREALEAQHKRAPSWRHAVVAKAIQLAASGDLDAMKWIADRTDGKVTESRSVEVAGSVLVEVHHVRRAPDPDRASGAAPGPGAGAG